MINLREQSEIREKLNALIRQRNTCKISSAARGILTRYIRALNWVLQDPNVEDLLFSKECKDALNYVYRS